MVWMPSGFIDVAEVGQAAIAALVVRQPVEELLAVALGEVGADTHVVFADQVDRRSRSLRRSRRPSPARPRLRNGGNIVTPTKPPASAMNSQLRVASCCADAPSAPTGRQCE